MVQMQQIFKHDGFVYVLLPLSLIIIVILMQHYWVNDSRNCVGHPFIIAFILLCMVQAVAGMWSVLLVIDSMFFWYNAFMLSTLLMMVPLQLLACNILSGSACNVVRMLLMDEPTNGLDILSKSQFRKVVVQGMDENKTVLVSTHQVHDVERLLDHVTIIDGNRVLMHEPLNEDNGPVDLEKLFVETVEAARACPGVSISGMIFTPRSWAYFSISTNWLRVM